MGIGLEADVDAQHRVSFCLWIIEIKVIALPRRLGNHAVCVSGAGVFTVQDVVDHHIQVNAFYAEGREAV